MIGYSDWFSNQRTQAVHDCTELSLELEYAALKIKHVTTDQHQELHVRSVLVKYPVLSCAPLFSVKDSKMYIIIYTIPLKLKTISSLWKTFFARNQGKQDINIFVWRTSSLFGRLFANMIF